ncbi:hypothetical protein I546_6459 [Mycobacterium kansasii 732]|nr:hypothetical protein I546_6459 [Mycobacterium kansasii 732]
MAHAVASAPGSGEQTRAGAPRTHGIAVAQRAWTWRAGAAVGRVDEKVAALADFNIRLTALPIGR